MHYDIVIVGGGPSGSILARELGTRWKIAIIDKRKMRSEDSTHPRKPCGGLIAPDAQAYLAKMGLGVPHSVLSGPQIYAVRTLDFDNGLERSYHRFYTNINREQFDRWLFSLGSMQDSVDGFDGSIVSGITDEGSCYRVSLKDGRSFTAAFVVGADGANSLVRRLLCGHTPKVYVGLQEWFKSDFNQHYHSAVFDQRITDFYSWTIPKEDLLVIGTAIPVGCPDMNDRFASLKSKLRGKGFNFGDRVLRESCYIFRPMKTDDIFLGKGRIGLIGEAAGWISPSSAEGLSYGFRSALALAKAINEHGLTEKVIPCYRHHCRSLYWNLRYKWLKNPVMYRKFIRGVIMQSGLRAL